MRDVLRVQTERVELVQHETDPGFAPMRRDERAVENAYNTQDPETVATEILADAATFAAFLDALDDNGWRRSGVYNFPEPRLRTVEWIAIHTTHELLHHRGDLR